jgi:hypothetical protein
MFQTVAMQACYFAIRPMVSYRALELGGSTRDLGIIAGAFGLASLLIALAPKAMAFLSLNFAWWAMPINQSTDSVVQQFAIFCNLKSTIQTPPRFY